MKSGRIVAIVAIIVIIVALLIVWLLIPGPMRPVDDVPSTPTPMITSSLEPPLFREVAIESGIDFRYRNGEEANHFTILESLGGGVGLFDYDRDGKLDVFLVGGGYFDAGKPFAVKGLPNRLYRNLGDWKFADVTAQVGLDGPIFYGHGVAVADYDCDGWPDLLVTGYGRLALYHNVAAADGGRRFTDATDSSLLKMPQWATSAAWGDLDNNGYPDLYICQYVDWSPAKHMTCIGANGQPDVCPPQRFDPLAAFLYRNLGGGRFEDRTVSSKIRADGKGLGVLIIDVNEDGRPDIYVANDATEKFLYVNRGEWRFDEIARTAGVALDDHGTYDGSMGVDAVDLDGAGRPSLLVTNFQGEWHAMYRNQGKERFEFASQPTGIASLGQEYVGFGVAFADFDLDGIEDLIIANGHVLRSPTGSTHRQKPVLMRGVEEKGRRRFVRWDRGGEFFKQTHAARGLAVGDLDNDGRSDVVISRQNEGVAVLRNIGATGSQEWIGLELIGRGNRSIVGTRLQIETTPIQWRFVKGGGSYLSSGDPRWTIAPGDTRTTPGITIQWSGQKAEDRQSIRGSGYGRYPESKP